MKKRLLLFTVVLMMVHVTAIAAPDDDGSMYNVALTSVSSPRPSPQKSQPVTFSLRNLGKDLSNVNALVMVNGQRVIEQTIALSGVLHQGDSATVTLDKPLTLDYGRTSTISVKVGLPDVTEVDTSDNNLTYVVDMPKEQTFPYAWNDTVSGNDFYVSSQWSYTTNYTFRYMGVKNKLKSDITSGVFHFGEGKDVKCSFVYNISDDAVAYLLSYDGEKTDTLSTDTLRGNHGSYTQEMLIGHVVGDAQLSLHFAFPFRSNSYVVLNVSNIEFAESLPDIQAVGILSPTSATVATQDSVWVSARFANVSAFDFVNPELCYSIAGTRVVETYVGTFKAGTTIDYTFSKPYVIEEPCVESLIVWCHADGDGNEANDSITGSSIEYYAPMAFPYSTTFDDYNNLWTIIDSGNDGWIWEFGQLDGNRFLGFRASYGSYDDYAVSPAIRMPEGKARLAFYYAATGHNTHLTVLRGRTPNPSEMKEVVFDGDLTHSNWTQLYAPLSTSLAGNYYFAFHLTGGTDQVLIDNMAVDANEDLCAIGISSDEKSGFNKHQAHITLSFANHGMSEQRNIEVAYYVGSTSNEPVAREKVIDPVLPGDTISYTFATPLDISGADSTYKLIGVVATPMGNDLRNDTVRGESITVYPNMNLPYHNDFTDESRRDQWVMQSPNDKNHWVINIQNPDYPNYSDAYSHAACMRFSNSSVADNDAWAFSECIEMKPGVYDFSFFYKTSSGFTNDGAKKDLAVWLGNYPDSDSMATCVASMKDILVPGDAYAKYTGKLVITQSGNYYLGFHAAGTHRSGNLYVDELNISEPTEGTKLPYTSDFSDDWYTYYPKFTQWERTDNGMEVDREANSLGHSEGYIVSPKLYFEKGRNVRISFTYKLTANSENIKLCLFKGNENNPACFTAIDTLGSTDTTMTVETSYRATEADSCIYLAFKSNSSYDNDVLSTDSYNICLYSMKVVYAEATAVSEMPESNPDEVLDMYDLQGELVDRGLWKDISGRHHGVFIIGTSKGLKRKLVVR